MENGITVHDPGANGITRQGMDGQAIERRDTAAIAMAEKQKAIVQARIQQAMYAPRDMLQVRDQILRACLRPGFAATAMYAKPQGRSLIEGLSVRFAEEAARYFKNLDVSNVVIHEDAARRIIYVAATDLESNYSTSQEVVLEKTVERRSVKEGQAVVAKRQNSYGDMVYIVEASEDEMQTKSGANLSKARRNLILQMIPGDIQDEAKATIRATLKAGEKAVDPAAARKALVDRYSLKLGVTPAQLAEYLGKNIDDALPDECRRLNDIANAIEEKHTTWLAVVEEASQSDAATGDGKAAAGPSKTEEAIAKARASKATKAATAPIASGSRVAPTEAPAERRVVEQDFPTVEDIFLDDIAHATTKASLGLVGNEIEKAKSQRQIDGPAHQRLLVAFRTKNNSLPQ